MTFPRRGSLHFGAAIPLAYADAAAAPRFAATGGEMLAGGVRKIVRRRGRPVARLLTLSGVKSE